MKQNNLTKIALAGVITISGAVMPASAAERLHVTVPFSFLVGNTKMSAGDYNVTKSESGVVTLSGAKTSAMVLTLPAEYSKTNASALDFKAVGASPVLTTIEMGGPGSLVRQIPLSSGNERKIALVSAQ